MRVSRTRGDSRLAPSQWEALSQSNAVSHWLGANLGSFLLTDIHMRRSVPNMMSMRFKMSIAWKLLIFAIPIAKQKGVTSAICCMSSNIATFMRRLEGPLSSMINGCYHGTLPVTLNTPIQKRYIWHRYGKNRLIIQTHTRSHKRRQGTAKTWLFVGTSLIIVYSTVYSGADQRKY